MRISAPPVLMFLAAAAACVSPASAEPVVVNRVAATVNGRPVTSAEVRMALAPAVRELSVLYPRQGPQFVAELVKAKKAVLNELIERELVLSEFESKGYVMQERYVDSEINRRILVHFNGDRDAFLNMLRQSGMTFEDYRRNVVKEVSVDMMRSMRYERGVPPSPDAVRQEYRRMGSELRDLTKDEIVYDKILLAAQDPSTPGNSPDEQYQRACNLCDRIRSGKMSFADAAREYSSDSHAKDGGRWPKMKRSDLAPDFAGVIFNAEEGKILGPLADPYGFTIVRVVRKDLAPAPPLSDETVRERVESSVVRTRSEARYREWVERLRANAVIRTYI